MFKFSTQRGGAADDPSVLASPDPSGRRWQSSDVGGSLAGRDGVEPAAAPLTAAGLPVRPPAAPPPSSGGDAQPQQTPMAAAAGVRHCHQVALTIM